MIRAGHRVGGTALYLASALAHGGASAVAAVPAAERAALVALYESTGGSAWTERDGWLGGEGSECSWRGVVCDQAGEHVVELHLWSNNLHGPLPAALGDLKHVRNAYLCCNAISGEIPAAISGMTALQRLYLYDNELAGALPATLGQVTGIEEMRLASNRLSGELPAEIGALAALRVLDLSDNLLTGALPAALGSLDALEELELAGNEVSGALPPELAGMASIRRLNLAGNALSGEIPAALGGAATLRHLDLSQNQLSGAIPPALGALPSLAGLYLAYNALGGAIPPELGALSTLRQLYLGGNQLTGEIPAALAGMTALEDLSAESNQLSGALPAELGSLASLRSLALQNNQLSGAIPPSLGNLASLEAMSLWSNRLDGTIPPQLGSLTRLTWLAACCNLLSGAIPAELGQLAALRSLYLFSNRLTGPIPPSLGQLSALTTLQLSDNLLSGAIPAALGGLGEVRELLLDDNDLTGGIPASLGGAAKLVRLGLSHNELTGEIPAELGALSSLAQLHLWDNHLSGAIPPTLGALANLEELWLAQNRLEGALPEALGGLVHARQIHVAGNRLAGSVPASLASLPALADGSGLDLRFNALAAAGPALDAFLDAKNGLDWSATQTVAPGAAAAVAGADGSVRVSWAPIAFSDGGGRYRVRYSLASGGPFTVAGATPDKLAGELTVTGLAAGATYYFTVEAESDPHGNNQSTVTSAPGAAAMAGTAGVAARAILPGIASQNGQNDTTWRSEGVVANPHAAAANVLLELVPRDAAAVTARRAYDLAAGQVVRIADLYGALGAASGFGSLRVTGPAAAWVRTFNQGAAGTFGQDVVPAADAEVPAGQVVVFPVYTPADVKTDFRSNFLAVNLEAGAITLSLRIGASSLPLTVAGGTYVQRNLVGAAVGAAPGLGMLEVSGSGRWSGSVSTVDPVTGDPATVRALRPSGAGGTAVFAGVASQTGHNGTQWRSQAVLHNPGAAPGSATLEIVPRGASAAAASAVLTLAPGEVRQVPDLFAELAAGSGSGALRVSGDVLAWVRTFNRGVAGTFGQDVPPVTRPEFAADEGVLFPFERPADVATGFRSNMLLLNLGTTPVTITLSGAGTSRTVAVAAGAYAQVNNVGAYLGAAEGVWVLRAVGNGAWSGYVSTIDPLTGDPTTVRGVKAP